MLVGLFFLPRFLQAGIYTIPEYLEFRYDVRTRTLMALFIMLAYVFVALATVLYSGALALESIFGIDLNLGIWLIGILAGGYTIYGGLKAVVWSDLIQGVALLLGGVVVTVLGFKAIGGIEPFLEVADGKLHTVLPWNHPEMPWLAVFVGGLWIPNLFYWGLNQFITQRTLAARSLADGQRGIFLAGFIKLAIPFIIVFPGIMAAELFADQVTNPDQAYPVMMRELLPAGLTGAMFAALFGAVMSSLDSMLNSAATIFSVDLYKRHMRPEASSRRLMVIGRWTTAVLALVGCLWAPLVAKAGSVFDYIQMFWGFISPGIVAAFLFGLFVPRTPPLAAFGGMIMGIPVYGLLLWLLPEVAFLHHMAITFLVISAYMATLTLRQDWLPPPTPRPSTTTRASGAITPAPTTSTTGRTFTASRIRTPSAAAATSPSSHPGSASTRTVNTSSPEAPTVTTAWNRATLASPSSAPASSRGCTNIPRTLTPSPTRPRNPARRGTGRPHRHSS